MKGRRGGQYASTRPRSPSRSPGPSHRPGTDGRRCPADRLPVCGPASPDRVAAHGRQVAVSPPHYRREPRRHLSLRAVAERRPLALGDVGQRGRRPALDRGVDAVLLVRRHLRQLQPHLWVGRCGRRLHGLLWISAVIVLLGGELNAEMEHQTARDTTEGGGKPLGSRGAMTADHVGKAQG